MRSSTKQSIRDGCSITTDVSIDADKTLRVTLKGEIELIGPLGEPVRITADHLMSLLQPRVCDCKQQIEELHKKLETLQKPDEPPHQQDQPVEQQPVINEPIVTSEAPKQRGRKRNNLAY